jgi:thiol reductant ABC exporter CydD subunit
MRLIDPELIRRSGSIRSAIVVTVLTGLVAAAASVVQAGAAAAVVSRAFLGHQSLDRLSGFVVAFAAAWLVRAGANAAQDVWARRSGLRAVAALRREVALAYADSADAPDATFALLSRGIDALEVYVARYLPQLVLAALVPVGLGAVVLQRDWWSAVVLVVTIPLIPLFMVLIGWFTQSTITRQWSAVGRITTVIDDLFSGLADLVIFDRAKAQASLIRRLGSDAANATMKMLRVSFLSSFALELIATISVAIVALGIGLRLTNGGIDLETGLMVLILVPDVYLPIRLVGTQFHAAVEGMEAWAQAAPMLGSRDARTAGLEGPVDMIELRGLETGYGRALHAPLTLTLVPGTLTAITGRSGTGKSTLLRVLAGLTQPLAGSVEVHGMGIHAIRDDDWFPRVGYVPQDPWIGHGTVREALRRGTDAADDECRRALVAVGLADLSLDARIDDLGHGVSVGQRRRIALARYRLRRCEVLLLDEPTAAVDAESESRILHLLDTWRSEGAIIVAVAHRPALARAAQQVIHLVGVA